MPTYHVSGARVKSVIGSQFNPTRGRPCGPGRIGPRIDVEDSIVSQQSTPDVHWDGDIIGLRSANDGVAVARVSAQMATRVMSDRSLLVDLPSESAGIMNLRCGDSQTFGESTSGVFLAASCIYIPRTSVQVVLSVQLDRRKAKASSYCSTTHGTVCLVLVPNMI